ncbi:MAG: 4-hydroxy-3-methylbut-2-enyl diphosphate reductase, partial [Actinobacteria bacterium]|nr:4-hydroxy-3-methylbut-2-enyl diphosphate reductase [Actinomycetota bacterium]
GEWADARAAVRERFPDVWTPARSDLCFATTNRQTALKALAEKVDAIIVIGSQTSSNTNALERVARESGCGRVVRIETVDGLSQVDGLGGVVGVTAGASVPERLVREVLERLAPLDGIEDLRVTDEDEYFPLPARLRGLIPDDQLGADRHRDAGTALDHLAEQVTASERTA